MTTEITNCIDILNKGGLILYPTDTVWAIGCDATNESSVKKVLSLKNTTDNPMVCLVANQAMLERYIEKVPDLAYDIIDLASKPTTIVFDEPKGFAKNLVAKDNTIAIRVASDKFCQYLINKYKKPLVATTASSFGASIPKKFTSISNEILKGVDYVVTLHQEKENLAPSSIIKLSNDGTVKVIRE